MNKFSNRILNRAWILVLAMVLVLTIMPSPALAAPSAQSVDNGLQVSGALLELNATPGQVYVHKMTVAIGANSPALDITVEARGFGESLQGSFLPLTPDEDHSPYSARSFITNISKPSFHLDPGGSLPVDATIMVPNDLGSNTRYAIIYIHSQPVNQGQGVSQILAASVPVVITPAGAQFNQTGTISDLKVNPVIAGQPIQILATVQNTGNRHYKVKGEATISDPSGQVVVNLSIPLTVTSIIPTFSQQLQATYTALDRPQGLAPGKYTVEMKVIQEDGTLIDTKQTTFEVTAAFQMCPGVDASHMAVYSFNDEEPGAINASDKTGVDITFENTGKVTGKVAICAYSQEPAGTPQFIDQLDSGGTGVTPIKFVSVRVDGFNQGVAHLAVHYQPDELGSIDPSSLILAYKDNGVWRKLDNLMVQTGAELVVGDQQVAVLVNGPLIGLGGGAVANPQPPAAPQPNLLVIGLIAVLIVMLILVVWLVLSRNRRNNPPNQARK